MKSWQGLLGLLVLTVWTMGCSTPRGTESLERELRYQEDMIYQLQDYIETYKSYLDECRRENQACHQKGGAPGKKRSVFGSERKSDDVQLLPPAVKLPGKIKPPKIELPDIEQGSLNQLNGGGSSDAVMAQLIDSEWAYPLPDKVTLARYQESIVRHSAVPTPLMGNLPVDPVINSLALGQENVGVYAGEPDSGGIWVLLEPRNAINQVVRPAGELSVAVLNPKAYSEKQARFANWKFSPEQMEMITKGMPPGEGLLLELPWINKPSEQKVLHLYLRLITPNGDRLVADHLIDVSQNSSQRAFESEGAGGAWTKRTRPRPRTFTAAIPISSDHPNAAQTSSPGHVVPASGAENRKPAASWNPQSTYRKPGRRKRPEWSPNR